MCLLALLCPTLWDPMDCNLPGCSVHGISQARILKWVPISSSRGSSPPWDWTCISFIAGRFFTCWATGEALYPSIYLPIHLFFFSAYCVQTLFWEYSGGQNSLNFFSYGSYFPVQETNINKQITLLDNHRLKPPILARHDDNHLGELSHNRRSQWETWYCHLKTNQENLGGAKRGRRQTSDIGLVLNSMEKIKWSRGQWGFPGGPSGKEAACQCRRCGFDPWVRKTPWRRTWQSIPLFLPGKIPWTEETGGLQSMGLQRDRTEATLVFMPGDSERWGMLF